MKKIMLILAILLTNVFAYGQVPNSWTQKADFAGAPRLGAVGFSINGKGYMGTGQGNNGNKNVYYTDFWEYDPVTDTWAQKADFGGGERTGATGFSIGGKGYIGAGFWWDGFINVYSFGDFWEYSPNNNAWKQKAGIPGASRSGAAGFSIGGKGYIGAGFYTNGGASEYLNDFSEYDPASDTWTQKADFGGGERSGVAGFSIGNKGYMGMGSHYGSYKDFWEYDPAADKWTQKADFGESGAVGFSIGSKGYIGGGKDFWEYDPSANNWIQKADFIGGGGLSVGFSIGSLGYAGFGYDIDGYKNYWWQYTPENTCTAPVNLRVPRISYSCVRLNWNLPDSSAQHVKINYRQTGTSTWIEKRKGAGETSIFLCGLTPNTTYQWRLKNICISDNSEWVKGPNFTTTSYGAIASNAGTINARKIEANLSVQILPNPNKGDFTIKMHLPDKAASTTLSLYNNLGAKIWQQDAGKLSGSVSKNIDLENKLSPGIYVMVIQHGDAGMMEKVVVVR